MAAKSFLIVCASACFVKIVSSQVMGPLNSIAAADEMAFNNGRPVGAGLGALRAGPIGYGAAPYGAAPGFGLNAANSCGFAVTSTSPISPTGISVVSENAIEGPLAITGQLPFLGAVALEGSLPSGGVGGIEYRGGNGAVGIVSEGLAPAMAPAAYPGYGVPGLAGGFGYPGLAGPRAFNRVV